MSGAIVPRHAGRPGQDARLVGRRKALPVIASLDSSPISPVRHEGTHLRSDSSAPPARHAGGCPGQRGRSIVTATLRSATPPAIALHHEGPAGRVSERSYGPAAGRLAGPCDRSTSRAMIRRSPTDDQCCAWKLFPGSDAARRAIQRSIDAPPARSAGGGLGEARTIAVKPAPAFPPTLQATRRVRGACAGPPARWV